MRQAKPDNYKINNWAEIQMQPSLSPKTKTNYTRRGLAVGAWGGGDRHVCSLMVCSPHSCSGWWCVPSEELTSFICLQACLGVRWRCSIYGLFQFASEYLVCRADVKKSEEESPVFVQVWKVWGHADQTVSNSYLWVQEWVGLDGIRHYLIYFSGTPLHRIQCRWSSCDLFNRASMGCAFTFYLWIWI